MPPALHPRRAPAPRFSLSLLVLALLAACERRGATRPRPSSARPAVFDVHEWGLIDAQAGERLAELSAGPGRPARPMVARKPVLYFHMRDGDDATVSVDVRVPGGSLLEHWPRGELGPDAVRWPSVALRPCACAEPLRVGAAACASRDAFCETPELPRYVTTDHDCLGVGPTATSLLFYRAAVPDAALPLRAERDATGSVELTLRRDASLADAPGGVMRITTRPDGSRVSATVGFPVRGQTVVIPPATAALGPAAAREALRAALLAQRLTASEAAVFLTAWGDELFGPVPVATPQPRAAPREITARDAAPRGRDVVVFWLPPPAIDAIAPLTIRPAPRAVHRAWLVRLDLL